MNLTPSKFDSIISYKDQLAKEYKDPYIQVITPSWPWWVPGLVLLDAVEHAYLNEDPVHMDRWIFTPRGHVYRSWEFPLAFADLDRAPANAEDAIRAAKTAIFLENSHTNQGVFFSADDFDNVPNVRQRITSTHIYMTTMPGNKSSQRMRSQNLFNVCKLKNKYRIR